MPGRRRWTAKLAALGLLTAAVAVGGLALTRGGRGGPSTAATATTPAPANQAFRVKPYLQPGDDPGGLVVMWQTDDRDADWSVELAPGAGPKASAGPPSWRRVDVGDPVVAPFRLFRAALGGLTPGGRFTYRVRRGGQDVFEAIGRAGPRAGSAQRFAVFGDGAAGTGGQRAVAYQTYRAEPDYVMITGDVVYDRGRISEYLGRFFPAYNADDASPAAGAPLLRTTPVYAAPGNHDLIVADLDQYPDGLGFFYYWDQPRNGPSLRPGGPDTPRLKGSEARRRAFLEAAGASFPRGGSFSFDRGRVHWTVLDSNTYADWTGPELRAWLEADLASPAARQADWRFVAYHHPGFSSSKAHKDDQRMRLVAPVLERGKVDLVFAGHVHNYQRSRPLRFVPGPPPPDAKGHPYGPDGQVPGTWTLDGRFDGVNQTRPDGVIHIVTGGGGAKLYDGNQTDNPSTWQTFTARFVSDVHSVTVVDVTPAALAVRQVDEHGREIDRFVVTR